MRGGGVLPDPGKVFMLEFSSAIVFDSSPNLYIRHVNCGDVGDKSKKTGDRAPVFFNSFDQMIFDLTSLRYRRLRQL